MESWLPACCPSADVVVREQRLTQLGLVMEGEGKKNSRATRQHVLLPVFVSTYYVLPACGWGWGNFKRKESSGPCEKIPSFKRTQTKSEMAKTMVREGKVNSQSRFPISSCRVLLKSCHPLQWPVITMPIHRPLKQLNSKITHTYYPLRSSSAEKAGFSDPDSALCQNANPIDAPLNLVLSQYTSAVRAGYWFFFVSVIKAHRVSVLLNCQRPEK